MSNFKNSLQVTNLNSSLRENFNNLVNNLPAEKIAELEEQARLKGYAGAWEAFRHGEFKEIHYNSKTKNDEHSLNFSDR